MVFQASLLDMQLVVKSRDVEADFASAAPLKDVILHKDFYLEFGKNVLITSTVASNSLRGYN